MLALAEQIIEKGLKKGLLRRPGAQAQRARVSGPILPWLPTRLVLRLTLRLWRVRVVTVFVPLFEARRGAPFFVFLSYRFT